MKTRDKSMLPSSKEEANEEIKLLFHLLGQHRAEGVKDAVKAGKAGLEQDDHEQVRQSLRQIQDILQSWSLHPALNSQLEMANEAAQYGQTQEHDAAQRAQQIFSLRADSVRDLERFQQAAERVGIDMELRMGAEQTPPNVDVEMTASNADLLQLQGVLMTVEDSHVMMETLRDCPLSENSLEREEPQKNRAPATHARQQGPSL